MGFSISNIEGCHKWKKIWWLSNFYFTIKWLIWILISLWVAMGTVNTFNTTLLWSVATSALAYFTPETLAKSLNKWLFLQTKIKQGKKPIRLQKSSTPTKEGLLSIPFKHQILPIQPNPPYFAQRSSDQIQWVTRQTDLPHSSCKVSGKGGNGTGKEGRRPLARIPSHSNHPK